MRIEAYLATAVEWNEYKAQLPGNPEAAETMRLDRWERPTAKLTVSECSFSRAVCDDLPLYRARLPVGCVQALMAFLKPTVFSCWREGKPIADLEIRGYDFCGALAPSSRAGLINTFASLNPGEIAPVYQSTHQIGFPVFVAYLESWVSLLRSVVLSEKFLLLKAG